MRNIREVIINGVSLEEILKKHEKWLNNEVDGEKANLSYADLNFVDLANVNLTDANLSYTNLIGANLRNADLNYTNLIGAILADANLIGANLRNANLSCANLKSANLSCANLKSANLRNVYLNYADLNDAILSYTNLTNANLRGANLSYTNLNYSNLKSANLSCANLIGAILADANLIGANLKSANLSCANLCNAKLKNINLNDIKYYENTAFFALQCPEKGSFIGYKKADNKIIELLITEDAKRSSATTRKCRCSKAKVLSITNVDNTEKYDEVISNFDKNFIYKVGEIVEVDNFDEDRWNECSTGIRFFMTRDEAVKY